MSNDITLDEAIAVVRRQSMSVEEAATALGLREQTVRTHIAAGRLVAIRGSERVRLPLDEIERYRQHQATWRTRRTEAEAEDE